MTMDDNTGRGQPGGQMKLKMMIALAGLILLSATGIGRPTAAAAGDAATGGPISFTLQ